MVTEELFGASEYLEALNSIKSTGLSKGFYLIYKLIFSKEWEYRMADDRLDFK